MRTLLGLLVLGSLVVAGQDRTAFEVATLKPINPDPSVVKLVGIDLQPGHVSITTFSLKALILAAYGYPYWQISGGEPWMDNEKYNLEAKPPASMPITNLRHSYYTVEDPQLRQMLQALLAERFQLKVHRETKQGDVYNLVRTNRPLTLIPAEEAKTEDEARRATSAQVGWAGRWGIYNCDMAGIASFASENMLHAPVLDRTGVPGIFNYRSQNMDPPNEDHTDSFLRMIQEVGLKFDKVKGEVPSLVIDSASKPSDN